ncbi:MAG: UPF0182 family protein [Clostridiales bacterium]|nr:UPF0182 family protein [Clostridiales bacterium]MDY4060243.1 UPF0182 family protein [Anaerovoracaceae bacterium]
MKNIGKATSFNEKKRNKIITAVVGIMIPVLFISLIDFIVDWLWFGELGYVAVFFTKLFTQIKIGLPIFIVVFLLVNFYLHKVRKGYFTKIVSSEETDLKRLRTYTSLLSVIFGAFAAIFAMKVLWFPLLQFLNSTDFKIKDPIFGMDVSFYVFKLEFLQTVNQLVIALTLIIIVVTIIYYLILLTMRTPDPLPDEEDENDYTYVDGNDYEDFKDLHGILGELFKRIFVTKKNPGINRQAATSGKTYFNQIVEIARHQFIALGIFFFLMLALNFYLQQFELLHTHRGVVYGAGFTDLNVTLWVYRILMIMSLVGAVFVIPMIKRKNYRKIFVIPAAMIVIGLAGMGVAAAVQNFVVSPDEINKESKYLKRNIEFTQYAYDLDNVDVKSFPAENSLTADDIKNNNQTISNIRINDYKPVKTFYNQTQSIRQYYTFNDVDVDRYNIGDEITQTYMSVREIDEEKINDTWLNRHLKYTHGYGATLSRVDTVTPSGQPSVMIKNIPPETDKEELKINRPEVYFGELSNDYILVDTKEDEFDYPDGNDNRYTRYKGTAGIKLNPFNRLLFSIKERSLKLLVSSNIKGDSRIIINRNVVDRIRKVMPYLTYEEDPYAVNINGKLYWMMDAYTTSSQYPYSEPFVSEKAKASGNYIRNSIKVVVDAYNGDTNFYIVDKDDPLARTYQKIFPTLFKDVEKMPEAMREHMRYPHAMFKVQSEIYSRYHMNDVKVFYQKEDLWDVAKQIYGTEEISMEPNYFVAKLPGEGEAEFISTLPFTPKGKNNMTALMVARNDGKNYGNLVVYQFPKSKTVYGPMQIEAQIDQNTEISQDFSLWNSAGSKYSRGNLFVVPIESSLLYVEPVYLEASNSAIPEVKRVIIAYGDKIAYEATLKEALQSLFGDQAGEAYTQGITTESNGQGSGDTKNGEKSGDSSKDGQDSMATLIDKANKAFEDGQKSMKDGDWKGYGDHMNELADLLKKLKDK